MVLWRDINLEKNYFYKIEGKKTDTSTSVAGVYVAAFSVVKRNRYSLYLELHTSSSIEHLLKDYVQ